MTKCYSVRLKSLESISNKCYKAICFDGSSDLIPKSQVLGVDSSVTKSEAYWITEWILERKNLTYSRKKYTMFSNGKNIGKYEFKHHVPKKVNFKNINHDESLKRSEKK